MTGKVPYDESCEPPFSTTWFRRRVMFLNINSNHEELKNVRHFRLVKLISASFINDQIALKMLACIHESNGLGVYLNNELLKAVGVDTADLTDSPFLTTNKIRIITVIM